MIDLEEKKQNQLKYMHVPWITVQQTSFRSNKKTFSRPSTSVELPSPLKKTVRPFTNSRKDFTEDEMHYIRGFPNFDSKGLQLERTPSKLIQLQTQQQLRNLQRSRTKSTNKVAAENQYDISKISDADSFVSINGDDCFLEFDEEDAKVLQVEHFEDIAPEPTPLVSTKDVREQIWIFCHNNTHKDDPNVSEFKGEILPSKGSVKLNDSKGQKKIKKVVAFHSGLENPNDIRSSKSNEAKKREGEYRTKMGECLSAYRYCQYIDQNHWQYTDFIKNVDFKATTAQSSIRTPKKAPGGGL